MGTSQVCLGLLILGNWEGAEVQVYSRGVCFLSLFCCFGVLVVGFFFSPVSHEGCSWLFMFSVMVQSLEKDLY